MAFPASSNKRTRSQTTLSQFFPQNLAASPMKQARKNASSERRPDTPPVVPSTSTNADDDSTMHDHLLKRPPSPAKDAALQHQPDLKRPRNALFPPPKPSSLPHRAQPTSSPDRRAKSVPPPASTVPLLDLNNVPPSPRRSPSKFRIASVPPSSSRGSSPEPDPFNGPHPPSANSPTFTFAHATPVQTATSNLNSIPAPFMTPMSPLTPLPPSMELSLCADSSLDINATPVPASRKLDTSTPMDATPRPSSSTVPQPGTHSPAGTPTPLAHPLHRNSPPKPVKSRMRSRGQGVAAVPPPSVPSAVSSQASKKHKRPQTSRKSSLLGTAPRSNRSASVLHKPPSGVLTRAKSEAPDNSRTAAGSPFSLVLFALPESCVMLTLRHHLCKASLLSPQPVYPRNHSLLPRPEHLRLSPFHTKLLEQTHRPVLGHVLGRSLHNRSSEQSLSLHNR
ncbi:hypothetical protein C8Q80DRAFT_488853 [Daedaleopsis nitida]|nr:hypothetical protein C8Q80DRAFT_488853 [Daedaleopsis nitida]